MMHFLDHVFPRQYPMYNPEILEGGRGWLLPLLMQSKPFHHAALASAAHHRWASTITNVSFSRQNEAIMQQGRHLEMCLEYLREAAENSCPWKNLGISTGVLQLVFFEVTFFILRFYLGLY